MTIQQAIEKAIEGGYRHEEINSAFILWKGYENILPFVNGYGWVQFRDKNNQPSEPCPAYVPKCRIEQILLDPEFWKALGKSFKWESSELECIDDDHTVFEDENGNKITCPNCPYDKWKEMWHRFIDHLAEGNSIESYFETL